MRLNQDAQSAGQGEICSAQDDNEVQNADTGSTETGNRRPGKPNPLTPAEPEFLALGSSGAGNGADNCRGNGDANGVLVDGEETQAEPGQLDAADRDSAGRFDRADPGDVDAEMAAVMGKQAGQAAKKAGAILPDPLIAGYNSEEAGIAARRFAADLMVGAIGSKSRYQGEPITPEITPELPLSQDVDFVEDNFRYELEFLEQKSGVIVKLRERARFTFDGKRPSNILGVFACGKLTKRQLAALRAKTLPPGVKAALAQGDISYEVLESIFRRPGKGATSAARKAGKAFRQNQA